jgi:hypothetical protein
MIRVFKRAILTTAAVTLVAAGACTGGEGSPTISSPSSAGGATSPITAAASLTALLLRPDDLPGNQLDPTPPAQPAAPCGARFADTSAATGRAGASFRSADSQQAIDETVGRYPGASAAQLAADFRRRGASCASFSAPGGTYQARALAPPAVGDDVAAVAVNGTSGFADLIIVRYGSELAWIVISRIGGPIDEATLASVTTKAANRLAGLAGP